LTAAKLVTFIGTDFKLVSLYMGWKKFPIQIQKEDSPSSRKIPINFQDDFRALERLQQYPTKFSV
jgi:hypothetical protein